MLLRVSFKLIIFDELISLANRVSLGGAADANLFFKKGGAFQM